MTFVKGGRGANISELSFVTGLKSSKVSTSLKMMNSNELTSVFDVRTDEIEGLVKSCQRHDVARTLPKNQLTRHFLRNMYRNNGPLGKLYLVSLRVHEEQKGTIKKLETADLKDLLTFIIPTVVKYLKNCKTFEYKLIKLILQITIRAAHTAVERAANLYEDIESMDNRILVLRHMEKTLEGVETGMMKVRRRRELVDELECWHKKLETIAIPA